METTIINSNFLNEVIKLHEYWDIYIQESEDNTVIPLLAHQLKLLELFRDNDLLIEVLENQPQNQVIHMNSIYLSIIRYMLNDKLLKLV